jgi:hypothetical protein
MSSTRRLADAAYDTEQGIFYFISKAKHLVLLLPFTKILITPPFRTLKIHIALIKNESYIAPKQ